MSIFERNFFWGASRPNNNERQGPRGGDIGVMRDDASILEVDRLD